MLYDTCGCTSEVQGSGPFDAERLEVRGPISTVVDVVGDLMDGGEPFGFLAAPVARPHRCSPAIGFGLPGQTHGLVTFYRSYSRFRRPKPQARGNVSAQDIPANPLVTFFVPWTGSPTTCGPSSQRKTCVLSRSCSLTSPMVSTSSAASPLREKVSRRTLRRLSRLGPRSRR